MCSSHFFSIKKAPGIRCFGVIMFLAMVPFSERGLLWLQTINKHLLKQLRRLLKFFATEEPAKPQRLLPAVLFLRLPQSLKRNSIVLKDLVQGCCEALHLVFIFADIIKPL